MTLMMEASSVAVVIQPYPYRFIWRSSIHLIRDKVEATVRSHYYVQYEYSWYHTDSHVTFSNADF